MALQSCRECGKPVSTEATTCPHCGVPRPTAPAADTPHLIQPEDLATPSSADAQPSASPSSGFWARNEGSLQDLLRRSQPGGLSRRDNVVVALVLAAVAVVGVLYLVAGVMDATDPTAMATSAPPPPARPSPAELFPPTVAAGDHAVIRRDGVLGCALREDFERVMEDRETFTQTLGEFIASGRCVRFPAGHPVYVVAGRAPHTSMLVRVGSGGSIYWVAETGLVVVRRRRDRAVNDAVQAEKLVEFYHACRRVDASWYRG